MGWTACWWGNHECAAPGRPKQARTAGEAEGTPVTTPLLRRVAETDREPVHFLVDGWPCAALAGDTVLTAVLTNIGRLRHNEFSGAPRAGFCMMGACQDCWIETGDGERLRACARIIEPAMVLLTEPGQPE